MKRLYIIFLLTLLFPASWGQSLIPSIPTSPQAASFRRVGEYTVNNSSGIPDISIPLYEINHYGYKIPLTLRYIASPVKPGYNYDVYGYGWSLTPGCCISRTIESMPDEAKGFKLSTDKLSGYYGRNPEFRTHENWMYDKYNATLPDGSAFDFVMEKDASGLFSFMISDGRQVKIDCSYSSGTIKSFTVVDEQGVKYLFDIAETVFAAPGSLSTGCNTSWYLSRIDLPHSAQPITFSYNYGIKTKLVQGYDEPTILLTHLREEGNHIVRTIRESNVTNIYYQMRLLTGIYYGNNHINVLYQKNDNEAVRNYAQGILIKEGDEVRRSYRMQYHTRQLSYDNSLTNLTRLVVSGKENSADSLVYKFAYSGLSSYTAGTDHWGHCNANGNSNNVAKFNFYVEFDTDKQPASAFANLICKVAKKSSDLCPYWKLCMQQNTMTDTRQATGPNSHSVLTSIVYPTGGRTEFVFENHRFITATDEQGNYAYSNKKRNIIAGGGFRIKQITNYTADGKMADVKNYRYGHPRYQLETKGDRFPYGDATSWQMHVGYGLPVVDPNVMTYADPAPSITALPNLRFMLQGLNPFGKPGAFSNPFHDYLGYYWECRFSALNFQRLLNGRTAVVYPEITVYHGEIDEEENGIAGKTLGKTTYTYKVSNAEMGNDSLSLWAPGVYGNVLACNEKKYMHNYLQKKEEYIFNNGYFKIIGSESYQYMNYISDRVYDYIYCNTYAPQYYPEQTPIRNSFSTKETEYGCLKLFLKTSVTERMGGSVKVHETYYHNMRLQLEKRLTEGSKNIETNLVYPQLSDTASAVEQKMVERNIISPVLNSFSLSQAADRRVIDGYRVEYAEFTPDGKSLILPSRLYRLPVNSSSAAYEEEERVLTYSPNGNPMEVVGRDGTHTVYLWGYGDRYQIATIVNATLQQAENAVQAVFGTSVKALSDTSPDIAKLRELQSSALLGNAQVTTYTYRPLTGVTSVTPPSGNTTYYDYDDLDRLKEVYRYEGNVASAANKRIVEQYSYHTINH